ncbi:hypothetical protein ACT453_61800, partial [Bacillus sp. D-CC]
ILVVFTNASLSMALLHSLFISCLFAVLCYLVMLGTANKQEMNSECNNAIDKLAFVNTTKIPTIA